MKRLALFAIAFALLTPPTVSSAMPCGRFLQKFAFWRKSEATLIDAVKKREAMQVFPSIHIEQISALNYALERSRLKGRYTPQRVDELLPIGHVIYFYEGTVFSLNRIGVKLHRLPKKFARFAIEAMGGDLRLLDYAAAFDAETPARILFFNGPLTNWKLKGGALEGEVTVLKGVNFYDLKFSAGVERTTFKLVPRRQGPLLGPKPAAPTRRAYSEQVQALLAPGWAQAMVPSGYETVEFIEELKSIGFTFLVAPPKARTPTPIESPGTATLDP